MRYLKPTIVEAGVASQAIQGLMVKGNDVTDSMVDPIRPLSTAGSYRIDE